MPTAIEIVVFGLAGIGALVVIAVVVAAGLIFLALALGDRRRRKFDRTLEQIANMDVGGGSVDRLAPTKPGTPQPPAHDAVSAQAHP